MGAAGVHRLWADAEGEGGRPAEVCAVWGVVPGAAVPVLDAGDSAVQRGEWKLDPLLDHRGGGVPVGESSEHLRGLHAK